MTAGFQPTGNTPFKPFVQPSTATTFLEGNHGYIDFASTSPMKMTKFASPPVVQGKKSPMVTFGSFKMDAGAVEQQQALYEKLVKTPAPKDLGMQRGDSLSNYNQHPRQSYENLDLAAQNEPLEMVKTRSQVRGNPATK